MSLFHKKENQKKNNDQLIKLMKQMIAGILACVFCLVSMTWAWFTASVNTPPQTIQSATRSTSVAVYEISQPETGNSNVKKTLVKPDKSEAVSLAKESQTTEEEASEVVASELLEWNLSPEKSYEVVMTGSGTASTGYCKVALSHTASGSDTETKLYTTKAFKKDHTFKFTYNTGGFESVEGVTHTQWKEYVENTTPPTLKIESYWGKPAEEEEITPLSDGQTVGITPIPCPEAKAETEVLLEGFETEAGAVISAEEDYKISLTLKDGYEMPGEVVVNINGKDYVVSTQVAQASNATPYYDAQNRVLTVPSSLLSDGATVSVKATATQIPVEEPEEETTEETTENTEKEEDNSADTSSDNSVVADNPTKKEEDSEKGKDRPKRNPIVGGGNDDDDDDNSEGSSSGDTSSSDKNEDEKADVKLNLSQLTINLEETQIPTNADLVLTLAAKEDMELPEKITITLDRTIRDENIEDEENEDNEEIIEDKTEYIINTDGKDNPEGFEFDAESGELTISSQLLEGVREITIADTEKNEDIEEDELATITFEVKNLTFDFTDDEIATDEDVVITFTAGEGYELPETIIITIDGEEYIVYTSEEDSDKNPEGITFDTETGTLTISKDLLEDVKAITIAAEGIKKENDESEEKDENSDADKKDESEDKDTTGKENENEGGEATDKETEGGTDVPGADNKTENEGEITTPETNPDNTTEGKDEGKTETMEPDTEPTNPTEPDVENNTDSEQGSEDGKTEENGEGTTENGTGEATKPTPDTESGDDSIAPAEPDESVVTPETPKTETPGTSESETGGNNGEDNSGTTNGDSSLAENSSNSKNDSTQSNEASESTTSPSQSATQAVPTTSAPDASKTSTPSASNSSSSNGASQTFGTTTSSESKETSSEE